ncbi:GGDEF domain-containing protein [Cryobacterium sp. Hh38]|uniref:GGDEF domain-containing protein n=1 Tax=Cryobacterium sp. Hh38 TaxID=1259156 RepID=UPI001069BFF5|nr:GGDEF domain-containing protein [Cryobacterium sp. Hh38]TFD60480.1 GGDEF domain-containing protein [Cryobacterium sp. Hh38]
MELDTLTLLVINGAVVALCGVSFILNTAFQQNDPVGRIWSVAFIAAMVVIIAHGSSVNGELIWWTNVLANVALCVAVGSVWGGLLRYNRRSRRLGFWVIAAACVLVFAAMLLHGDAAARWAGAAELWMAVGVLAALGAIEASRGRLRRNLSGRVLALVLWVTAVTTVTRASVFAIDGATGSVFQGYFNTANVTALSICLVIPLSIAVSVLRAQQVQGSAVGDLTDGIHSAAGVLSATAFSQAATDHLARAQNAGTALALIGADIDNLPEINISFGRAAGDEAISRFAGKLRASAPVLSIIGHRASGRFLVLVGASTPDEARALAERIRAKLVDEPLPQTSLIRLTASFGIADTTHHGYDLTALGGAVNDAIAEVQGCGGNDIAVRLEVRS